MPLTTGAPVRRAHRRLAAVVAALAGAATLVVPAGSAEATPYRFWSYWKWSGSSWTFMNVGPQGNLAAGTVIGWRFAIQQDSSHASPPRAAGDFTPLCGSHTNGIGVVIDYGVRSDAPSGETPPRSTPRGFCATQPDDTNGYRATAEHAVLRVNGSGLVCGIDGYPKRECGAAVSTQPSPTAAPTRDTTTTTRHHHDTHPATQATPPASEPSPALSAAAAPPRPHASTTPSPPHVASHTSMPSPTPTIDIGAPAPVADRHAGAPVGLIIGLVVAVALAGAAVLRFRSRP